MLRLILRLGPSSGLVRPRVLPAGPVALGSRSVPGSGGPRRLHSGGAGSRALPAGSSGFIHRATALRCSELAGGRQSKRFYSLPPHNKGGGKSPRRRDQHTDLDSWPSTNNCQSHNSSPSTKILYFTGKSPTPSMINIPKRLGEVTLKDVKAAVDREGNYRYHFKALDPEFGTVKEEVFLDGAVIPGWEGKIVAWLEENHGEERPL